MRALAAICTILALAGCASPKGGDGSLRGEPADVWVPRFMSYTAQCQSAYPAIRKCMYEKEGAYQGERADRLPPQQLALLETGDGSLLGEPAEVWVRRIFSHTAVCGYPADMITGLITAPESELPAIEKCIREQERAYQAGRGRRVAWTHSYIDTLDSRRYQQPALGVYCVEC